MGRGRCNQPLTNAQQALARDNFALVGWAIGKWGTGFSSDDLNGACVDALIRATRSFDPNRGIRFSTYAGVSMQSAIKRHLGQRQSRRETLLNEQSPPAGLVSPSRCRDLIDVADVRAALGRIPRRCAAILKARYAIGQPKKTQTEVGAMIGMSKSYAAVAERESVAWLRRAALGAAR